LGENPKALGRIVVGKSSNLQEVEDGRWNSNLIDYLFNVTSTMLNIVLREGSQ
jgi:hypothetical protein